MMAGPELPPCEAAEMTAHVVELCEQYDVAWRPASLLWSDSNIDSTFREFRSPPIGRTLDYLAALHEVGHAALQLSEYDENGRVSAESEVRVAEWALDKSMIVPSHEDGDHLAYALTMKGISPDDPAAARLRQRLGDFPEQMSWKDARAPASCANISS